MRTIASPFRGRGLILAIAQCDTDKLLVILTAYAGDADMLREKPLVAVVNDEVAFVRLLDALLVDEGFATLLLQSGEIAYESIKQHVPDLIILDISGTQPEASWKVVDLLVVDPATIAIPAIVCTVADQAYRDRLPKLQSLGYIMVEKPFGLDELVTHIHTSLSRPGT